MPYMYLLGCCPTSEDRNLTSTAVIQAVLESHHPCLHTFDHVRHAVKHLCVLCPLAKVVCKVLWMQSPVLSNQTWGLELGSLQTSLSGYFSQFLLRGSAANQFVVEMAQDNALPSLLATLCSNSRHIA